MIPPLPGRPEEGLLPWLLVTTVGTREQARELARQVVEQRLAACVQITEIESVYRWQAAVHQEPEFRLTCKTTATSLDALRAALLAQHPYQQPVLESIAIDHADPATLAWLAEAAGGSSDGPTQQA